MRSIVVSLLLLLLAGCSKPVAVTPHMPPDIAAPCPERPLLTSGDTHAVELHISYLNYLYDWCSLKHRIAVKINGGRDGR